jgi:hypothetical protein
MPGTRPGRTRGGCRDETPQSISFPRTALRETGAAFAGACRRLASLEQGCGRL